jgi:hypothetical protein
MKIRIKGNSIRLRLTKTEVDSFAKDGFIEEKTEFGDNHFSYRMESSSNHQQLSAAYSGNLITVFIPISIAENWTSTELVGFENKMDIGNNKQLFLLVEKDFVCLDNTFEDQSDNFPNPNAVC